MAEKQLLLSQERMFVLIEDFIGYPVRPAANQADQPDDDERAEAPGGAEGAEPAGAGGPVATRWPAPDPATLITMSPAAVVRVGRPVSAPTPTMESRSGPSRTWVANAVAIAVVLAVIAAALALINLF